MIAVIAMMADHIAVAVLEQGMLEACAGDAVIFQQFMASEEGRTFYMIDRGLRAFGRVSFPIICFLLTQGFFYSRNRKNYVVRLVLAALISEPFFDIAIFGSWFYIQYQNVLFTYAAALLVLMGMELPLAAIRRQIASGVDLIVHLGRLRDGSRKVLEIVETDGIREGEICLHSLFEFQEEGGDRSQVQGSLRKKDGLRHSEKLRAAGIGGW